MSFAVRTIVSPWGSPISNQWILYIVVNGILLPLWMYVMTLYTVMQIFGRDKTIELIANDSINIIHMILASNIIIRFVGDYTFCLPVCADVAMTCTLQLALLCQIGHSSQPMDE